MRKIDATRLSGKFVGDDGSIPEEGQDLVELSLQRCYNMAEVALARWVPARSWQNTGSRDSSHGSIATSLYDLADELFSIRNKLEKLELTQAWSLRETDLFDLLKPLLAIDEARRDGKFVGTDDTTPEDGQSVSLESCRPRLDRALIYLGRFFCISSDARTHTSTLS